MIQLTKQELDVVLNKLFPKHNERNCGLDYEIVDAIEDKRSGAKKMYEYLLNLPQAGEGWIGIDTPPEKSGWFWCLIVDIDNATYQRERYYQVNLGWCEDWHSGDRITHYLRHLPAPPIDSQEQKKEEV